MEKHFSEYKEKEHEMLKRKYYGKEILILKKEKNGKSKDMRKTMMKYLREKREYKIP